MTQKTTSLEDILTQGGGIKGFKNKIVTNAINFVTCKIKDTFGVELEFDGIRDVENAMILIKKFDKKFEQHTQAVFNSMHSRIINTEFIMKVAKDTYAFVHGGKNSKGVRDENTASYIYMYIFGKRASIFAKYFEAEIGKLSVTYQFKYTITGSQSKDGSNQYWNCIGTPLINRNFNTLYFDNNIESKIIRCIDDWIANEHIYTDRGLIFKTGILLYGTPGTGKSSIANAIATYLKCDLICIDTPSFEHINIAEVTDSINADDKRFVILLDEIDSIFKSREEADITDQQKAKITKLLTFLDSVQSPNNVVFVATTNYFNKLDAALIRSGRFDKVLEVLDLSKETAIRMCKGFKLSTEETNKVLEQFGEGVKKYNPSDLQVKILEMLRKRNLNKK